MGYYADLIKQKQEKRNSYKYKDREGEIYIIEKAPNGKYFYKQEGMGGSVGPFSSFEEAEMMLKKHRTTIYKVNSKENSILSTEMYKGYKIEVYKAKSGVDYGFNIYEKSGSLFDWGMYFDSERDALRWAKLAIDRKANSKEEKEEGYYAKLAAEKKNGKAYANEDIPFTKKSECVATLDKIINLAQRKKSQVQGWRYIDEDFDENEFASDLKDALRAVENIIE